MEEIRMYGTSWCPSVAEVRALLDERGIPYQYFDIDEDKKARKAVYRLQQGGRRVPTLTLPDGTLVVEPDVTKVERMIAGWGGSGAGEAGGLPGERGPAGLSGGQVGGRPDHDRPGEQAARPPEGRPAGRAPHRSGERPAGEDR
ncbi:glutaredoxin family protein [Uniformispora flossi]|uniref:glutaredoxin family protein n=1 Tax=Uniformispora flossi TaxID=3390723 RepID=UPI003C2E42DA